MKLLSIEFENFMTFSHKIFDLSKPLNIVCGRNGSGKSSILEGIALSFQIKERNSAVGDYVRWVAPGQEKPKKAKIILKAEYLGEPLIIKTELSESGRKITRLVEYKGEEYENMKGNKFISKFFNTSKMKLAFSLQGNDRYIDSSPTVNLNNFIELFGLSFEDKLEVLSGAYKDSQEKLNNCASKIYVSNGKSKTLEDMKSQLTEDIKSIQDFLNKVEEKDVSELQIKLEGLKQELSTLNTAREEYKKQVNKYNDWVNQLNSIESNINSCTKKLNSITIVKPTESYEDYEKELDTILTSLSNCSKAISTYKIDKAGYENKITENLRKLRLISSGRCPLCESTISKEKINKDNTDVSLLQEGLKNVEIKITEEEEKEKELKKLEKDTRDLISRLKREMMEYTNNQTLFKEFEDSLNNWKAQQEATQKNPVNQPVPIDETALNELREEVEKIGRVIESTTNNNKEIEFKNRKLEESKKSLQDYNLKIKEVETEEASIVKEKEEWEDKLEVIRDADLILNLLPKLNLASLKEDIEKEAKNVVSKFGYGFIVEIKDGISFFLEKVVEGGTIAVPYRSQSSFEKILTNVAFITAVQTYLGLPFICIDEVDNSADIVNAKLFKDLMNELSSVLQVILITHETDSLNEYIQDGRVSFINLCNPQEVLD